MERIQIVERPSLGECEQPQCSLNAINLCTTHRRKICNECSAIFHYGCNLKIDNGEDFIKVAKDAIDYLVQDISDEGVKYRINRDYPEFDDCMKDLKDKANQFKNKLKNEGNDIYGIASKCDQCRGFIKEINESLIYQVLCSYQFKSKIGNKLSTNFDEHEGIFLDNIRAQHHLKAMKDYQDFIENSQKNLIKEFKTILSDFMNNIQEQLEETNQRITDASELSNKKLIETEHELLTLVNKNNEEIKSISDKSSNKMKKLKKKNKK